MSHFTVLVIGPNPEEQLAPFHEFECTGINDQYVTDVDITDKVLLRVAGKGEYQHGSETLDEALDYWGLGDRIVEDEGEVDTSSDHKYGYAIVKDGVLIKAVNRTNENAHWDWYLVGGRWTGFFKLKAGAVGELGRPGLMTPVPSNGRADQLTLGDIDVEGMRLDAAKEAGERWDLLASVMGNPMPTIRPWADYVDEPTLTWNERREAYHAQAPLVALENFRRTNHDSPLYKEQVELLSWLVYEDYMVSREAYAERFANSAMSTYAVVKDGQWYECGKMGWWGMALDEKDKEAWGLEFAKLIDGLPLDTQLTLVDCHI